MNIIKSYWTVRYYCPIQSNLKTRKLQTFNSVKAFLEGKRSLIEVKKHGPVESSLYFKGTVQDFFRSVENA